MDLVYKGTFRLSSRTHHTFTDIKELRHLSFYF